MQKAICDPTFEDSIILGQRSHSWQREQMFPSVNKSFISALFDLCHCRDFKLSFPRSNRATTSAFFAFPPRSSRKPRLFIIHSFTWNHTTPLHLLFPSPPVKACLTYRFCAYVWSRWEYRLTAWNRTVKTKQSFWLKAPPCWLNM